jgi:phosphoglucan,water dikinase
MLGFQWGDEGSLQVSAEGPASNGAAGNAHAHEAAEPQQASFSEPGGQQPPQQQEGGGPGPGSNGATASDDDRLPHQRWQGRSTRFMRSNEHSRERAGVWNTSGLEGSALALVKGDEGSGR